MPACLRYDASIPPCCTGKDYREICIWLDIFAINQHPSQEQVDLLVPGSEGDVCPPS